MNNFDLHRFSQALKCYFMTSRRTWLRYFGIFTLVMFMADLFFTRIQGHNFADMVEWWGLEEAIYLYKDYVGSTAVFGLVFFFIAMLFGASFLFSHMKETRQRTTYLMWPVSNLEKYLVPLVHNILLLGVGTLVAYHLADALRVLVDWTTGRVVIWGWPMFWDIVSRPFDGSAPWQLTAFVIGSYLWFHSLYILGGSLFRRQQFLLTSIAIVIGFFLFVWTTHTLAEVSGVNNRFEFMALHDGVWHVHWSYYIILTAEYGLTALHYWLSYKIFCRMQVINNKWLNV